MGEEPEVIRRDIEETRERMGGTVDALAYKADVKSRAKDRVAGVKEKVVGAAPDTGDVKDGARQAVSVAQENPLGLAIGAAAFGFVAGLIVPSTRVENEKLGPVSDQVTEQIKSTASEAVEHGKEVAQDAAQAAADTAKESGQKHADRLQESAQQSAQSISS
jgi:gas vesicle protein